VLEGEVPSDVLVILNKWLSKMNSQLLTERLFVYSTMESEDTKDISLKCERCRQRQTGNLFAYGFFAQTAMDASAIKSQSFPLPVTGW